MEDRGPAWDESESWQANSADEQPEFLARWLQRHHKLATDPAPEVLASAPVDYEDMPPTEPTVPPSISPETTEERIPPSLPEAVPDTDSLVEQHVAPKEVMEQIVEAAEHNQPLERAYERRQEIKDDPAVPAGVQGAVTIGHVLSQSPVARSGNTEGQSSASATTEPLFDQQTETLYQTAVRRGFFLATVIILALLVVYLFKS